MRVMIYILAFLGLLGSGFWAYRENYAMRDRLQEVRALNADIAALRDDLSTQRAEWAYLNRPDRLRELADLNADRLQLAPMEPLQLTAPRQVAYPAPQAELPVLEETPDGATSVQGDLEESVP